MSAIDFQERRNSMNELGLTSPEFIQHCTTEDLASLSNTFKKIPRRAFDRATKALNRTSMDSSPSNHFSEHDDPCSKPIGQSVQNPPAKQPSEM